MAAVVNRTTLAVIWAAIINSLKTAWGTITDPGHHHTSGAQAAKTMSDFCHYENPPAPGLTGLVNTADIANGAVAIAAQPAFPCKLQFRIVDANGSISAGIVTLVATGVRGQAINQVIPATGGTKTVITDDAIAHIISITPSGLVGNAAGDTLGVGPSSALGLPAMQTPTPSAFAVFKASVGFIDEAVGTVDATAGTIIPTTAPDGTKKYDFWYTYSYTPATAANTADATTGISAAVGGTSKVHKDASEVTPQLAACTDLPTACAVINELFAVYQTQMGPYPGHANDPLAHVAVDATNLSVAAKAVDLGTAQTRVNDLYTQYNAHRTQEGVHVNNDATNVANSPAATDLPSTIVRANDLRTQLIAHVANAAPGQSVRLADG